MDHHRIPRRPASGTFSKLRGPVSIDDQPPQSDLRPSIHGTPANSFSFTVQPTTNANRYPTAMSPGLTTATDQPLFNTLEPLLNGGNSGARAPPTPLPPPPSLQPAPLRYPETLGSLIGVRETEGKGLGVFALVDIPEGTALLSESPLVTLIDTGTRADPLDAAVASLSPDQRASFLSLSHYSRNPNESLHRSIVYSNGYSINNDLATGIFETASRINHSCVPNSAYVWKEQEGGGGRMVFWNVWKMLEGEEVTVDYGHRKGYLKRIYGFDCECGGCTEVGTVSTESMYEGVEEGKVVGEGMQMAVAVKNGLVGGGHEVKG